MFGTTYANIYRFHGKLFHRANASSRSTPGTGQTGQLQRVPLAGVPSPVLGPIRKCEVSAVHEIRVAVGFPMKSIDLNCDMGELPEAIADGTQEALLRSITSANVACGGHAGDEATMRATIEQAMQHNVAVGAHPGYPDRENFGRLELRMSPEDVANSVHEQVLALARVAEVLGPPIVHVKPHGALYNQAVKNRELARAIADGVARWRRDVVLVGLAGSPMLDVFREAGFAVAAEAFADRRYEPDGTLRSRKFDDALIRNPAEAAQQARRMVERGTVIASNGAEVPVAAQTICIHGDTPGSAQIAGAVAKTLRKAGVRLRGLSKS